MSLLKAGAGDGAKLPGRLPHLVSPKSSEIPASPDSPVGADAAVGELVSPASFWTPHFAPQDPWLPHVPFAFWLVETMRPTTIVEIGTGSGLSYIAFCQAVDALQLPTECWGLSDDIGARAVNELPAYNKAHYAAFSRLGAAASAPALWDGRPIDILHLRRPAPISSLRAEWATWAPLLSERSVVLVDGIHSSTNGLPDLWRELAAQTAHVEFLHGRGLGVLCVGRMLPAAVRALTENVRTARNARAIYARLGGCLEGDLRAVALRDEVEAAEIRIRRFKADARAHSLEAQKRDEQLRGLQNNLREAERRRHAEATLFEGERKKLAAAVDMVRASRSWRIMAPARFVSARLRGVRLHPDGQPSIPPEAERSPPMEQMSQATNAPEPVVPSPGAPSPARPVFRSGGHSFGRVAFFTAIAGAYDALAEPTVVDPDADYVVFTDQTVARHSIWNRRRFDFVHADPARTARFVKTHPHLYFPNHDRVVWVDGNLGIACNVAELLGADHQEHAIVTWRHPLRNCVYDELAECILRGKDDTESMRRHVESLRQAGYPEKAGLIESSVIVYDHTNPAVQALLANWWRLIDNGSRRDQLSFNPALWHHPEVNVGYFGERGVEMRTDPRFVYSHHHHSKWTDMGQ